MTYTFEIDPIQVLGVAPDASLEQIREAYRTRSKKYHPDLGGDEWAFRLVARSYELLSQARIAGRLATEAPAREVPPVAPRGPDADGATVRSGIRDQVGHPLLLLDVELLLLRMELENPYEVIARPAAERNLSCSLNVGWPSALAAGVEPGPDFDAEAMRAKIVEAFAAALLETRPSSNWQDAGLSSFRGWLSYSTAQECYAGFSTLRRSLKGLGLGVNQKIREIVIPREAG